MQALKKKKKEVVGFTNNNCPNLYYVEKKTNHCALEKYVFEFLDNKVEKVYKCYKKMNKNNDIIRKKQNKMSNTFKFFKRCKPMDIEMVSINKLNDKTKLMAWKMDLEVVSKLCCENSRKFYVDNKCTRNFNRTGL